MSRVKTSALLSSVLAAGIAHASTLEATSDLNLWLRADNVTISSGTTVGSWEDLTATGSGIGDNISQDAVLTNGGPTLVTNDAASNGRDVVNFGGGGGYEFSGTLGLSGASAYTGFVVTKLLNASSNADERVLQFGNASGTSGQIVAFDIDTPGTRYNNGNRLFGNDDFSTSEYGVGTWTSTAPSTYGSTQFFLNGTAGTQTSSNNVAANVNLVDQGYSLGRGIAANGADGNFANARVAEVLLFDTSLGQRAFEQTGFYLTHRYNLNASFTDAASVNEAASTNVNVGPAPDSAENGTHESNVDLFMFEEKTVTLGSNLDVDIISSGSYTGGSLGSIAGQISAGTTVQSVYVSMDLVDNSGAASFITSTIEFDQDILGIITASPRLDATDALLGSDLTTYSTGNVGLETDSTDVVDWGVNDRTLTVTLRVGGANIDQLRVVLAPEPSSLALLGLGGLLVARRRR